MNSLPVSEKPPRIVLVGMRGVGKSSVGRRLAADQQVDFIDADELFVQQHGQIADYFAQNGENAFRSAETAILHEVLARQGGFVFATGGGVVTQSVNRAAMLAADVFVCYLHAGAEVLSARLSRDTSGKRPTLLGGQSVSAEAAALLGQREPWYREVATAVIDAHLAQTAVVDACLQALRDCGKDVSSPEE